MNLAHELSQLFKLHLGATGYKYAVKTNLY